MYKGSLVNIRHQSIKDMEKFAHFMCTPEYLETHCSEDPRFTYKENLEKKFKEKFEKHNHNELHMTIETTDGKVIGAIGIDGIFWKNGLSWIYSYIGDKEYLEGGYHEEALALLLEYMFIEGNARKIKSSVQANDPNNLKIYKAKGFNIEVTNKADYLCHGEYIDNYEVAIFKDDYMKTYKK